jgi:hypothetical protein
VQAGCLCRWFLEEVAARFGVGVWVTGFDRGRHGFEKDRERNQSQKEEW